MKFKNIGKEKIESSWSQKAKEKGARKEEKFEEIQENEVSQMFG